MLSLAYFFIHFSIYAQKSEGGIPNSFSLMNSEKLKNIPTIIMPSFDISSLIKEDSINYYSSNTKPFRF